MIRVGTDCSGIEAPIQALMNLKIPFRHVFSSEIDPYARESIKANYKPDILFTDMTTRNITSVPDIDLYVCGFPCQSFSLAGNRKGIDDPRGTIFWYCLQVIKNKVPAVFVLENVKGLVSINKGETFREIIQSLENIGRYKLHWKILNTRDYGIPQNRERVFIIGIRNDFDHQFTWPSKKTLDDIRQYVDWEQTTENIVTPRVEKYLETLNKESIFIDLGFIVASKFTRSHLYSPCLNTQSNLYVVPLHRHATVCELLSLQGFPKRFKQVVSKTQLVKQIGNSMSVNVLEEIFKQIYCVN